MGGEREQRQPHGEAGQCERDRCCRGATTVNTAGQPVGQFAYATLAAPVTLAANTTYYLVSQEVNGGDQWYDACQLITSGATVTGAASAYNGTYYISPSGSYGYGPVNFIYCQFDPPVGNWTPNAGPDLGLNATGHYYINNPSEFADSSFSLF